MSASHDRKFFDTFMLVIGILVGIAIVLIAIARMITADSTAARQSGDALLEKQVEARIAPLAKVAVAGKDNSALAGVATAQALATPAAPAADLPGEQVYTQTCSLCHGAGVAGAPKFGDKAAWAPRIAQGMDTLYKHAIQGFQGKNGVMPAKGGRTDYSDKSIDNAVDYMVAAAK
ncbi:MAG: c-type cytochrome [Steroidobacteraceae bacterium]